MPEPQELLRVRPVEGAWRVSARAAVSVAVPLMVLVAMGRPELAPYASFGAFTSLYGRSLRWLTRVQMQMSAAVTLTMACLTGVLVGLVPGAAWLQVAVAGVIAATGQMIAKARSYHPPGPLFMIFAYGALSAMPHTRADLPRAAVVCGASALFSVVIGVAGLSVKPHLVREEIAATGLLGLRPVWNWQPAWMALAVVVAGTIAHLAGIGHPYWAMVAALAPLSAPHVTSQMTRGIHRAVGTLCGLVPAWLLLQAHLPATAVVAVLAVLQFATEMVVGANYAIALLFITPMALLMGELTSRHPVGQLLFDRAVETTIGAVVAMAVALTGHAIRQRRLRRASDARQPAEVAG